MFSVNFLYKSFRCLPYSKFTIYLYTFLKTHCQKLIPQIQQNLLRTKSVCTSVSICNKSGWQMSKNLTSYIHDAAAWFVIRNETAGSIYCIMHRIYYLFVDFNVLNFAFHIQYLRKFSEIMHRTEESNQYKNNKIIIKG